MVRYVIVSHRPLEKSLEGLLTTEGWKKTQESSLPSEPLWDKGYRWEHPESSTAMHIRETDDLTVVPLSITPSLLGRSIIEINPTGNGRPEVDEVALQIYSKIRSTIEPTVAYCRY